MNSSGMSLAAFALAFLNKQLPLLFWFMDRVMPSNERTGCSSATMMTFPNWTSAGSLHSYLKADPILPHCCETQCRGGTTRLVSGPEATPEMMEVSSTPGSKCVEEQLGKSLQGRAMP